MKQIVGYGDATTTGGRVVSATSTTLENSKRMSLSGDMATCGNCKGSFSIYGTVDTWTENGKSMVGHLDMVLCPCKKNRVLAFTETTIFIMDDGDGSRSVAASAASDEALSRRYDEQFVLRDRRTSVPLARVRYRVHTPAGQIADGVTDTNGATGRIATSKAERLAFQIFHA
jgi:uncharacterized Zn-binding protein involved in type VI secretion